MLPRLVYAALALLSLIWGGSFYFIKMLLHDFHPWTIAFLRSFSGLLTVSVVMLLLRQPFGFRKIAWVSMAVMAVVNTAIPWALIAYGETRVSSGLASVLNATTPIWTVIVGMLFFGGRTTRIQWLGLLVAFLGLLEVSGIRPGADVTMDMLGFACLIAATFCYAVGSQLSKRLMSSGLTMYQLTFGTFATMVTYLVPCTALVWGGLLLDEDITWNLLIGLVVILAGVFLAGRKPKANEELKADGNGYRRDPGQA